MTRAQKTLHTLSVTFLTLSLLILAPPNNVVADENNERVGTRAFPFLKRDVGARASSLGGAFTGLADDESAMHFNPAATSALEGRRILFGYQNFIAGINAGYIGFTTPLANQRALGFFLNYVDYGTFVRTDGSGAEIGEFGGTALVTGVNLSQVFSEKYKVGANAKLIYTKYDSYTATGAALDLGFHYTFRKRIPGYERRGFGSAGIAIQNLGAQLSTYTVDAEKDPLPIVARFGAAGRPRKIPLTFSGDVIIPADNDIHFAGGLEFDDIEYLSLRAGWSSLGENFRSDLDNSVIAGFNFGVGFKVNRLRIDYSVSPLNDLGETHRITASHNLSDLIE